MAESSFSVLYQSPFGRLRLISNGTALTSLLLPSQVTTDAHDHNSSADVPCLQEACRQLQAFFGGELRSFDLPLAPSYGTGFQRRVWEELCRLPFGTTINYSRLAARIGRPKAVRAVGAANGRNPIPIIVPCHRVIGSNGSLTGYAGGTDMKRQLLELEAQIIDHRPGVSDIMRCQRRGHKGIIEILDT